MIAELPVRIDPMALLEEGDTCRVCGDGTMAWDECDGFRCKNCGHETLEFPVDQCKEGLLTVKRVIEVVTMDEGEDYPDLFVFPDKEIFAVTGLIGGRRFEDEGWICFELENGECLELPDQMYVLVREDPRREDLAK